jgi:hypothetical protein
MPRGISASPSPCPCVHIDPPGRSIYQLRALFALRWFSALKPNRRPTAAIPFQETGETGPEEGENNYTVTPNKVFSHLCGGDHCDRDGTNVFHSKTRSVRVNACLLFPDIHLISFKANNDGQPSLTKAACRIRR